MHVTTFKRENHPCHNLIIEYQQSVVDIHISLENTIRVLEPNWVEEPLYIDATTKIYI
jgi:hypothetical protein